MEKEEEEGTEKSVTEQALRESRAKFVSITLLFKGRQLEHTRQLRWEGIIHCMERKWISIRTSQIVKKNDIPKESMMLQ